MAAVGELYAKLSLQADQFKAELDKCGAKTEEFSAKLQSVGRAALVAGGVITGVFTKMVYDFTKYTTEIDKVSKATGISVEALQELRYAAEQEHASFEALTQSLRILAMRIQQVDVEGQRARKVLEELGISVYDAGGKMRSMEEIMMDVGDRLRGIQDETKRAAVATELFGRQAFNILPFLTLGRDRIAELRQEARHLGIVLGKEAVERGKELQDQFQRLKAATLGFALAVAQQVIPIVSRFITILTNLTAKFKDLPRWVREIVSVGGILTGTLLTLAGTITTVIIPAITKLTTAIGILKAVISALGGPLSLVIGLLTTAAGVLGYLGIKTMALNEQADRIKKSSRELVDYTRRYTMEKRDLNKEIERMTERLKNLEETERKYVIALEQGRLKNREALEELRRTIEADRAYLEQLKALKEAKDALTNSTKKLNDALEDTNDKLKQMRVEEFIERLKASKGSFDAWLRYTTELSAEKMLETERETIEEEEKVLQERVRLAESVSSRLGDAFSNAFFSIVEGTKTVEKAFEDMVVGIIKEITRAIIKMLILKAIMSAMGLGWYPVPFMGMGFENPVFDIRAMLAGFYTSLREGASAFNEIGRRWVRDVFKYYSMGAEIAGVGREKEAPVILVQIESPPGAFVRSIKRLPRGELKILEEEILRKIRIEGERL